MQQGEGGVTQADLSELHTVRVSHDRAIRLLVAGIAYQLCIPYSEVGAHPGAMLEDSDGGPEVMVRTHSNPHCITLTLSSTTGTDPQLQS